jgi:C-terminal processing protease CtpA/Prc
VRPQPLIACRDVEASSRWYQHLLGCTSAHGGPEYERLVDPKRQRTEHGSEGLILQLHDWEVEHHHGPMGDPAKHPYGNGVEVLGFLPPEVAADAVAETMSKLADADVLVIDLRKNGGGSPHGVALMTSYLFGKKPVHLNDILYRSEDRTESFHTAPDVPGKHFGPKKPVFVLTSGRTFSAGEEFAYNLQALRRAKIVGETTGGGAHPTEFVRVSDHWGIGLPSARAINPVTKTNWEGTGVKPDIEVPAEQALEKALELAEKRGK